MQLHSESKNTSTASQKLETREWEDRGRRMKERKEDKKEGKKKKLQAFYGYFVSNKRKEEKSQLTLQWYVISRLFHYS